MNVCVYADLSNIQQRSHNVSHLFCVLVKIWNSTSLNVFNHNKKWKKISIRSNVKWILVTMVHRTCWNQGYSAYYYVIVIHMLLFKWWYVNNECIGPLKGWFSFVPTNKQANKRMYGVPKSVEKESWLMDGQKLKTIKCETYVTHEIVRHILLYFGRPKAVLAATATASTKSGNIVLTKRISRSYPNGNSRVYQ